MAGGYELLSVDSRRWNGQRQCCHRVRAAGLWHGHCPGSLRVYRNESAQAAEQEEAMKILIGVDDSKHSRAALEYVKKMTWPKGTQVLVVSAVRDVMPAYTEVYAASPAYSDRAMEDLFKFHQEIASDAEKALQGAGLQTEAKVLQGDPRSVIVDLARAEAADLIVVGSHGRTGMAKLLLGSVATHVVSHAPCSVMVVKLEK